jgi:hypothetical protein
VRRRWSRFSERCSGAEGSLSRAGPVAEGEMHEGTVALQTLPLFHVARQLMLNAFWVVGATHVVALSFAVLRATNASLNGRESMDEAGPGH